MKYTAFCAHRRIMIFVRVMGLLSLQKYSVYDFVKFDRFHHYDSMIIASTDEQDETLLVRQLNR